MAMTHIFLSKHPGYSYCVNKAKKKIRIEFNIKIGSSTIT